MSSLLASPNLKRNQSSRGVGSEYKTIVFRTEETFLHYAEPISRSKATLAQRFSTLAATWRQETAILSSITQKSMHPAYQEIIGLGSEAAPYILRELQQRPGHWFWALRAITGINPVKPEHQGRMFDMSADWVQWGRERGVIE